MSPTATPPEIHRPQPPQIGPGIHPSAVISGDCTIPASCTIGPFCILEGPITLGENVKLISHVCLRGPLTIGDGTIVYPHAALGFEPQDLKIKPGFPTAGVRIGKDCLIRECVTIHAASKSPDQGHPTTIGDRVFMMVSSHAGHDVRVDDDVVLVNAVLLAGHCHVARKATLGGEVAMHQFARVGEFAFVSGCTGHALDVPPYMIAGSRNHVHGINAVGLRRNGFPREHITMLRRAFREAFRVRLPRSEQVAVLRALAVDCPPVGVLADFVATSKRGVCAASNFAEDDGEE